MQSLKSGIARASVLLLVGVVFLTMVVVPSAAQYPYGVPIRSAAPAQATVTVNYYSLGYQEGKQDGRADASVGNVVWGWLFGLVDLVVVLASPPDVPVARAMAIQDTPEQYQMGYLEGYREGRQAARVSYSAVGWGLWAATFIVLLSAAG